ncbi:phosphatase [Nocardia sp. SYP-A9097]|uniref:HAD family acid phosphatase n=1 Tax=Nocardia sp. SYP-A9097 TaxID=2663237 RepID=UPI00129A9C82|nr:HAD family acid phosphatase [Nocardia sp. SYP-A9097]MRH90976.1 phosphatase [Nocardia sp. SYP-A9097]
MRRSLAFITAGIAVSLIAPLPSALADSGSSSLSGGTGSSSLSGGTGSGGSGSSSLSGGGGLPPYSQWIADVTTVVNQAQTYLTTALPGATKPAIVLDIDNSSLEAQYNPGIVIPAIQPVLHLTQWAKQHGAAIIFVTGRPSLLNAYTQVNLTSVGYTVDKLYGSPLTTISAGNTGLTAYKTASRVDIESQGYTIVANIGNNHFDLDGGHAQATFKLPDYDGKLS